MASTPSVHKNEENKSSTQNEEPIAARVDNQSADKPSQLSRSKKDKSKNLAATKNVEHTTSKSNQVTHASSPTTNLTSKDKGTKKINYSNETKKEQQDVIKNIKISAPKRSETKASSTPRTSQNSKDQEEAKKIKISEPKKSSTGEPSSSNLGKEKEKNKPSNKVIIKSTKEQPVHPLYHIRWKGFEKTTTDCICALCWKDIEYTPNEEKLRNSILEENDEQQYSLIFSRAEEELEQMHGSVLPETSILPCRHVFHSDCLPKTLLMQHCDPPCPVCLRLL